MSLARCGGAFECAACLDASVAKRLVVLQRIQSGKAMLVRIVAMLTKLIRPCRAVCGMRKQDEPLFDQDGSILMNDEGKKPCREDTARHGVVKSVSPSFWTFYFCTGDPFVPIPFLRWLHLRGDLVRDVRLARSRSARRLRRGFGAPKKLKLGPT